MGVGCTHVHLEIRLVPDASGVPSRSSRFAIRFVIGGPSFQRPPTRTLRNHVRYGTDTEP